MQQVVINKCYGGFSISRKALLRLRELGNECALKETDVGEKWGGTGEVRRDFDAFCYDIDRDDPQLIQVIKELGALANSGTAELKVVEIPDNVEWQIDEHDGLESIAEADGISPYYCYCQR